MKIIGKHDPITVSNLITTVSGAPGVGKTSLACTASNPILFDFDDGAYRAMARVDTIAIGRWSEVASVTADDLADYDTIVIDTVGRCLDKIKDYVVKANPKHARGDGEPSMQGYGVIKATFVNWMKRLREMDKDIVLVAHATEEKNGDDLIERLDIVGGSKQEIYKISDVMGRLFIENGKRIFFCEPTQFGFGKNPGRLKPIRVTEKADTLAKAIADTKAALNTVSADQAEVQKLLDIWTDSVEAADTPEAYTELVASLKSVDKRIYQKARVVLNDAAVKAGLKWTGQAFEEAECA